MMINISYNRTHGRTEELIGQVASRLKNGHECFMVLKDEKQAERILLRFLHKGLPDVESENWYKKPYDKNGTMIFIGIKLWIPK